MVFLTKLLQAIGFVPGIITSVEGLFNHHSGAEKKDAVISFLEAALATGDSLASGEIADQAGFKQGLSQIIDGTVQCLNASVWAKAKAVTPQV
jgi:hypothetical protein